MVPEQKTVGRKPGYRHPEDVRTKIQATQIINRLESHIMADKPILDVSQVNAAKALLNKVLPDLQSVAVGGPKDGEPISFTVIYEAKKGIDYSEGKP